jgi:hypothetical protein
MSEEAEESAECEAVTVNRGRMSEEVEESAE